MGLFQALAELAEELAHESSRLKRRAAIAHAITEMQQQSGPRDAGLLALYIAGTPFPESDQRKLNAGGALLTKSLLQVSGASNIELTAAFRLHGDMGAAAFDILTARRPQPQPPPLTLDGVAEAFDAMASARTTAARAAQVDNLLVHASPLEAKYLLKLMLGDMRIGVKQSLVEEAIASAVDVPATTVRHAVMLEADLARTVEQAFSGTLANARMRLFHPLGFMLASPVETSEDAVERFTAKPAADGETPTMQAFLEDKYDGMRAQLHCGDPEQPGRVSLYSRNRDDVTESFPELSEAFARVLEADPNEINRLIFDGEILGWDFAEARALPFAVLGQRIGRKNVSNEWRTRVPVVFMAFDLICADGELLLDLPLSERRNRLEAVVETLVTRVVSPLTIDERARGAQHVLFAQPESQGLERLLLSPSRLVESADEIDRAYADARARANEGVMLKAASSIYQPGRRGLAWVKLKRELATLDVVVTGAEFGHGRRAGILSDYTFAVRGPGGELRNVGKAYSGLTDAEITQMSAWMMDHTLEDHGHFRTVEPLMILEVAFNNIMRSSRHASGFALRFPRILRIRTDKPLDEIDTVERVEQIYESQVDKPADTDE